MIGYLRGTLLEKPLVANLGPVMIDVQGVGYVVYVTQRSLDQLPNIGETAALSIETQVREEAITLFGFTNAEEKSWFNRLLTVQGVGAKVALNILSTLPPQLLAQAIAASDKAMLSRPDGVGPKLAARLATELKDSVAAWLKQTPTLTLAPTSTQNLKPTPKTVKGQAASINPPEDNALREAISALSNLGYSPTDAMGAVARVQAANPDADLGLLVRLSLRELSNAV
jgi:Holliday junction DNA helicase RuvA